MMVVKPLVVLGTTVALVEIGWVLRLELVWFASALGGAYLLGLSLPHARRISITCDACGRVNRCKAKRFVEDDTFGCRGCGKTLTYTIRVLQPIETLAEKRP